MQIVYAVIITFIATTLFWLAIRWIWKSMTSYPELEDFIWQMKLRLDGSGKGEAWKKSEVPDLMIGLASNTEKYRLTYRMGIPEPEREALRQQCMADAANYAFMLWDRHHPKPVEILESEFEIHGHTLN
jgi:hypothetical protein